jgi:tetratricopeptide (TPR) repeat protein
MYVDLHEPDKAQTALRACIQNTQDIARNNYQVQRAHYLLGRTLLAEGKIAEAKSEMQISQKILQMSTEKNQGKSVQGTMQAPQQIPEAEHPDRAIVSSDAVQQERAYEKSLSGPIADSYNNLGVIAAQSGQYAQALQNFQSAKAWNPGMDGLDLNIGRAAYASQQFDQAVEPLKAYLATHPDSMNVRIMLAASQFEIKDYASAIASLNPVREEIRTNPSVESMYEEAQRRLKLQPKDGSQSPSAQK